MKKVIILMLFVFGFSLSYSQDLIKVIQKLTLANDSLQKQIIKPLEDSFLNLNIVHNAELEKLQGQIKVLENNKVDLNKKIKNFEKDKVDLNKKLDKNNIQYLETRLQQKTDSITLLRDTIKEKDRQIVVIKNENTQKERQRYADGQQSVYNQIAQFYNESFDKIIKSSTKLSVERDLLLVGNNETVKRKLQDLQKYFTAQQILAEKYNEQKVKNAQTQTGNIEQSELVKNLTTKLEKYKLCNDGLKNTINKILDIDKRFVANDDYTQKTKMQDILFELSWYFRNYRFNFTDYPYLSDIVLEIMNLKQKDANTNISHLLDKL